MDEKEWAMFYEYLGRIITMDKPAWRRRRAVVLDMATELGAMNDLQEFISWFDGYQVFSE